MAFPGMMGPPLDLSPSAFVAQRDAEAPVLDVRTPDEFAGGHLAGAVNVDVYAPDFLDRIRAMDLPAAAPVYLYCHSGARSGMAAQALRQLGHAGAANVGGLGPLVAAGAEVGE